MSRIIVFSGPTINSEAIKAILPAAVCLPPAASGDLYRLDVKPEDRILIVDGYFQHRFPVRHKEILWAMRQGALIAGASSLGAVRAAELFPFGVRGIGRVYEMFKRGEVVGDDEVMIAHGGAADEIGRAHV